MTLLSQAGLYLHIPFCLRKCSYCSFFSQVPRRGERQRFLSALRQQIAACAQLAEVRELTFTTFFVGGGTPSMLASSELAELLALCRSSFSWSTEEPEISIEVNPGTIDLSGFAELRQAGYNRLSMGVQSLENKELAAIGRIHDRGTALAAIRAARDAGFDNLSCDLMYGLPGQTTTSWRNTLERMLAEKPVHLSLYELTLEEGTPLWDQVHAGTCVLPDEDTVLSMMDLAHLLTAQQGLQRYEISNYALSGHECHHNVNYWENGLYLGLGPAAVSYLHGERRAAVANIDRYCQLSLHRQTVWCDIERLEQAAAFRETVIMGLRMTRGVSIAALQERFGMDPRTLYAEQLPRLIDQKLLTIQGDYLALTERGMALANQVMAELV